MKAPDTALQGQDTGARGGRCRSQSDFGMKIAFQSLEAGDLVGPDSFDNGGASNCRHMRLPNGEIAGVRAPAYSTAAVLHDY
ncbi:hypothetical protein [Variovorax sp. LjRoot178]|uniref:hypothetical protein n=1 Tax=Variovorax sp. LjRoot178 TaxID=3342277 RepID=UPI003ECC7105